MRTAARTITPISRAVLAAATRTCANGKMTPDKKYEEQQQMGRRVQGLTASGEFDIRPKPTAKGAPALFISIDDEWIERKRQIKGRLYRRPFICRLRTNESCEKERSRQGALFGIQCRYEEDKNDRGA